MYKQVLSAKGPIGDLEELCTYTQVHIVINSDASKLMLLQSPVPGAPEDVASVFVSET